MIVVDNTVLADAVFGNHEHREAAVRLSVIDPGWITVNLFRYELGNVAWKMVRFGKKWSEERAMDAMKMASALLTEVETNLHWSEVMALALKQQVSYYDASYVWLAQSRGLPLYSRDERLRRKCPDVVRAMPTT